MLRHGDYKLARERKPLQLLVLGQSLLIIRMHSTPPERGKLHLNLLLNILMILPHTSLLNNLADSVSAFLQHLQKNMAR